MSYDLHLFRPPANVDLGEAAQASYESGEDESDAPEIESVQTGRKELLASALMQKNPALQSFEFNYAELARLKGVSIEQARLQQRYIELNGPEDGNGIQVVIHDDTVGISVPYWHDERAAVSVWKEIWGYLQVLEGAEGFRTYDPQLDRVLDLGADSKAVRETYARGVAVIQSTAAEEHESTPKPWWKFW
jgi:hypothetical protein